MQSGKILICVAVALALFAVLQTVESKSAEGEAKAIEKKVDDEIKKLSKREADEDDGGKHKKSKKSRKGGSTTAAPGGSTTSAAPGASTTKAPADGSTTKAPAGGSTTKAAAGGSTTKAAAGGSTTKAAAGGSTTKAAAGGSSTAKPTGGASTTGHPDDPKGASTTTAAPGGGGSSSTKDPTKSDADAVETARKKQSEERDIIRKIYKELSNWKHWLAENNHRTLNPKAAKATWSVAEKVRQMAAEKPKRFYGRLDNSNWQ